MWTWIGYDTNTRLDDFEVSILCYIYVTIIILVTAVIFYWTYYKDKVLIKYKCIYIFVLILLLQYTSMVSTLFILNKYTVVSSYLGLELPIFNYKLQHLKQLFQTNLYNNYNFH